MDVDEPPKTRRERLREMARAAFELRWVLLTLSVLALSILLSGIFSVIAVLLAGALLLGARFGAVSARERIFEFDLSYAVRVMIGVMRAPPIRGRLMNETAKVIRSDAIPEMVVHGAIQAVDKYYDKAIVVAKITERAENFLVTFLESSRKDVDVATSNSSFERRGSVPGDPHDSVQGDPRDSVPSEPRYPDRLDDEQDAGDSDDSVESDDEEFRASSFAGPFSDRPTKRKESRLLKDFKVSSSLRVNFRDTLESVLQSMASGDLSLRDRSDDSKLRDLTPIALQDLIVKTLMSRLTREFSIETLRAVLRKPAIAKNIAAIVTAVQKAPKASQ